MFVLSSRLNSYVFIARWKQIDNNRRARQMAPCVLVFEDLDSMVTDKVRSYFLNEVE